MERRPKTMITVKLSGNKIISPQKEDEYYQEISSKSAAQDKKETTKALQGNCSSNHMLQLEKEK
jgi:hypothetical protein